MADSVTGIQDDSAELTVDLGSPKLFATVFIQNRCLYEENRKWFGQCELRLGNDGQAWSVIEPVLVISDIYDGGYF